MARDAGTPSRPVTDFRARRVWPMTDLSLAAQARRPAPRSRTTIFSRARSPA